MTTVVRRRRTRKRNPKKIRRSRRKRAPVIGMNNPFPTRYVAKLRYDLQGELNPPVGPDTYTIAVFRANSAFDPDFTGTGHQPRGYDQIAANYYQYCVISAKITVTIYSPQTTFNGAIGFISTQGDSTGLGTLNDYLESAHTNTVALSFQDASVRKITRAVNCFKFVGKRLNNYNPDSEMRAGIAANPSEVVYFHVGIGSMDVTNPVAFPVHIHLEQYVMFTEPRDPSQS